MAVILFALMLVALLTWEYLLSRKSRAAEAGDDAPIPQMMVNIEGFTLPQGVYYHPLHTWVKPLGDDTAVIGIDDIARRLLGMPESVVTPAIGSDLEAGQSCVLFRKEKRLASVISPISGEVVKVNTALKENPELASSDPFGKGWLMKLRSHRLGDQLSNLLAGSTATRWMESSVRRLKLQLNGAAVEFVQDGGFPLDDIGAGIDSGLWRRSVREFLGTEAETE
jgi:glycine cleavage system H protein